MVFTDLSIEMIVLQKNFFDILGAKKVVFFYVMLENSGINLNREFPLIVMGYL
jgi:hypothetical protein